jgi:hypothetical protein
MPTKLLAVSSTCRRALPLRGPIESITRRAVDTDATVPNSTPWPANTARSLTQRPPSATITAKPASTRPGACVDARSRVCASAAHSRSVSPIR